MPPPTGTLTLEDLGSNLPPTLPTGWRPTTSTPPPRDDPWAIIYEGGRQLHQQGHWSSRPPLSNYSRTRLWVIYGVMDCPIPELALCITSSLVDQAEPQLWSHNRRWLIALAALRLDDRDTWLASKPCYTGADLHHGCIEYFFGEEWREELS